MAHMAWKFQHKLLISFLALISLIIVPVLYFVNSAIDSASDAKIEASITASRKVFESIIRSRRKNHSDLAAAFIKLHPTLRAILGSATDESSDLFGEGSLPG